MRQLFAGLFDDAALFPPGNAPMVEAVPAHDRHLQAWYGARASGRSCAQTTGWVSSRRS